MKKLKVNLMMVLALVIGVATMSFKMASTASTYHYTGTANPGVFADPANWQPGTSPVACNTGEETPCQITAENQMDLQSKLNGKDNDEVLAIVDSKRE
ncbi:MAG: hypothetical protein BGP15_04270 [Sphingobacterium sp. 40-24]|uniref:hypothetical protein n=1 Tax=Sphingobacterium sp. 40-24 TaxID=1895843 RepID=UPI00095FDE3A|nr:hypothetical protein [Sphingobacterium sp. 40-24]OJZ06467.1 MAG: hypothetical protein BGP15_04270 [Sphingobacterium sp. 40-24]